MSNEEAIHESKLLEKFKNDIADYSSWSQKRETSAWIAITFYIVLLGTGFSFIYDKFGNALSYCELIFLITSIILFSIIIFTFIRSQFSALYDHKFNNIIKTIIVYYKNDVHLQKIKEMEYDYEKIDKYLIEESNTIRKNRKESYFGINHYFLVTIFLWELILPFGLIKKYILKKYNINPSERRQNTLEKQEGALYSLLILSSLILIVSLLYISKTDLTYYVGLFFILLILFICFLLNTFSRIKKEVSAINSQSK